MRLDDAVLIEISAEYRSPVKLAACATAETRTSHEHKTPHKPTLVIRWNGCIVMLVPRLLPLSVRTSLARLLIT